MANGERAALPLFVFLGPKSGKNYFFGAITSLAALAIRNLNPVLDSNSPRCQLKWELALNQLDAACSCQDAFSNRENAHKATKIAAALQ
jgi:hypothetical protein